MRRRIGILGGTFDPPHAGHLAIARAARDELGLSEVLLVPSHLPPHKTAQATPEERREMCGLLARDEGFAISDIELTRQGPTYTVDTLEALRRQYGEDELVYIIGSDTLFALPSWRSFERVAKLCAFAVAARPGHAEALENQGTAIERQYGARVTMLNFTGPDIASSDLREAIGRGEAPGDALPDDVAAYVTMRGLYRQPWDEAAVAAYVEANLSPFRAQHSFGVCQTARELARRYGLDEQRAGLAGLAHDIAKDMPHEMLLSEAQRYGLAVDKHERQSPGLLHGRIGACMAREVFAWRDEAVLEAIAWHVTGKPGNSDLAIAVNLADITEPGRGFPMVDSVREAAKTSLYGGMACAIARVTTFIMWDRRQAMHPITIEFYNDMLEKEAAGL